MASVTLSALAGSLLSPLRDVSLEKLIGYLWDYLSSASSPSSSSVEEAERQQQLKDSLVALEDAKLSVRSMQSRIMKLFEKHKQNERVVGLHNKLKDVGYDIQDLESEMRYMELERKVEEINKADQEADTSTSTRSLKRLFPFRRPTSSSSTEKKRRLLTSSQSSTMSTDDEIVGKVTSIVKQINSIESKLKDEIKLEEWFDQITLNGVYDPWEQHQFPQNKRVTTSSTNERKIYGRDDEIQRLIEFLTGPNVNGNNISVIPIVGLGGIGKTTLAQSVFNSREIENHFDKKAWIYVSDHFDRFRITKEMVDIISPADQRCSTTNLDLLERELKRHSTGKKFLLVLDDVWSDEWQQLLTPLQSAQAQAIKIIVTCRDRTVLRSIDKGNRIILKGLSDQDYWSLFVNCAFAERNPDNYSQALHNIGKRIMRKLKGSPLAAKTVGKVLGRSLTKKHWKDVLESDLWKLETDAHDIMPALALSYYHLPPHLQQCFVFCSMLPKYCTKYLEDLISMWIANGYIHESGSSSKTMEDIGRKYYYELQKMCFLDWGYPHFLMHDLMRDLAHLVSHGEICIYESLKDKKISRNVRHLYVKGLIDHELACETNNLRTLVLERADDLPAFVNHEAFKRIRVLVIVDADMQEFPDAICHLKHLQYLDLRDTCIKSIPESLCGFYQLRVLKLPSPQILLPSLFGNLINLQDLHMHQGGRDETLIYNMERERGVSISKLRNMNELRGVVSISGLENINNREEAMKSKLKEKRHIWQLNLCWYDGVNASKHDVQEEVLEGLQPHPNLKQLKVNGYMGSKVPSWLTTLALQNLQVLYLIRCRNWAYCLPAALGLLPSLEKLYLHNMENITVECDDSVTEMFPSLQRLILYKATISFKAKSTSTSSSQTTPGRCKLFPRLQYLSVEECDAVNGLHWPIYSALEQLHIRNSPGLDDQLPGCLYGLSSITTLHLTGAKIKTFPAKVMATLHALVILHLNNCNELLSVEGLQALPSLGNLFISKCPKFRSWCIEEMTELHHLYIASCQDLESLPVWLHRLPLLKRLTVDHCPKFHSLPVGGFPSSLETLEITNCDPGLMERCQKERSPEWQMIQHMPERIFDQLLRIY